MGEGLIPSLCPVRIFIVRHGETAWNAAGKLQGQLDVPLNAHGAAQAQAVGAFFRARLQCPSAPAPPIISSDLLRARQTAEAVCSAIGQPLERITLEPRLREVHFGAWQGSSWDELAALHPKEVDKWKRGEDPDWFIPGGGESVRARFYRVARGLTEHALLACCAGTREIVLVSHGGAMDDMGRLATSTAFGQGTGLIKRNCCISQLEFTPSACALGPTATLSCVSQFVAASPAFSNPENIVPASASTALGRWVLREWGGTAHLQGLDATLADPGADYSLAKRSALTCEL